MAGLVTILANPDCPHCVHATDTVAAWCVEMGLPVAGVDILHHPEMALDLRIEHSPAILFDRGGGRSAVFAGLPTHAEFVALAR